MVDASSKPRFAGLATIQSAGAATYSAKPPPLTSPNTSSPTRWRVTSAPTATTTPATSAPGMVRCGRRRPRAGRANIGRPVVKCQSSALTDAERTATRTSAGPISGTATSVTRSTSSGLP